MHLLHEYSKWEVDKNLSKDHLVVQRATCKICGYTKFSEYTVPCSFVDYKQIAQGNITQVGRVVGNYKIIEGTCQICGNTHTKQKNY